MRQLIKHNQKKKAYQIFDNAQNIKVYTLENCFAGRPANQLPGLSWYYNKINTL